jgi:hypothetical protein
MATKQNHVILSIDFDFFVREKLEYDWGHRENGLFIGPIWPIRAMQLLSQGIDPLKDVGLVEDPLELPNNLENLGWKFWKGSRLSIAESHSSAYHALKDRNNLEIINIDERILPFPRYRVTRYFKPDISRGVFRGHTVDGSTGSGVGSLTVPVNQPPRVHVRITLPFWP